MRVRYKKNTSETRRVYHSIYAKGLELAPAIPVGEGANYGCRGNVWLRRIVTTIMYFELGYALNDIAHATAEHHTTLMHQRDKHGQEPLSTVMYWDWHARTLAAVAEGYDTLPTSPSMLLHRMKQLFRT